MSDVKEIKAAKREALKKEVQKRREEGFVPAVVYGFEIEKPINIELNSLAVSKFYETTGESTVFKLVVDGEEPMDVLFHDIQKNPLTKDIIHVDFLRINMKETIQTDIPLTYNGVSEAIKSLGGTLVKNYNEVEVECLPSALVSEITVDISPLKTFEDDIKVKDLVVPEGIKILVDENQTIALVSAPRSEEEMKALDDEVKTEVGEVEKVDEKKEEEGEEKEEKKK